MLVVSRPQNGSPFGCDSHLLPRWSVSTHGHFDYWLRKVPQWWRYCVSRANKQLAKLLLRHFVHSFSKLHQSARSTPTCPQNCWQKFWTLLFRGLGGKYARMGVSVCVGKLRPGNLEDSHITLVSNQFELWKASVGWWARLQRRRGLLLRNRGLKSSRIALVRLPDRCECDWVAGCHCLHFQRHQRNSG